MDTISQILTLATGHKWLPLAIVVVGLLVSWTSDTSKFPVNIPDRYKPLVAIVLGQAYAVLEAVQGGSSWTTAVGHGVLVALSSAGLANLISTTIFNGNVPSWLSWVTALDPKRVAAKKAGLLKAPLFGRAQIVQKAA